MRRVTVYGLIIAWIFFLVYNSVFGFNYRAESFAEALCDFVFTAFIFSLFGVNVIRGYLSRSKENAKRCKVKGR